MISDKYIHGKAKNEMTYRAGTELYLQNCVDSIKFEFLGAKEPSTSAGAASKNAVRPPRAPEKSPTAPGTPSMRFVCDCSVTDGSKYHVSIKADETGDDVSYTCSCPSFWSTWGACRHIVAALKAVGPQWDERAKDVFTLGQSDKNKEFFGNLKQILSDGMADSEGKTGVHIVPSLCCSKEPDGQTSLRLEISVGKDKPYLVKDLRSFLQQLTEKKPIEFSKLFVFDPNHMAFDYKSKQLIRLLQRSLDDETRMYPSGGSAGVKMPRGKAAPAAVSMFDGRTFKMGSISFANFFDLFQEEQVSIRCEEPVGQAAYLRGGAGDKTRGELPRHAGEKNLCVYFSPQEMPLQKDDPEGGFGFCLSKYWKGHLQFQPKSEMPYPLVPDCRYLIYRGSLYRIHSRLAAVIRPFLEKFTEQAGVPLVIAASDIEAFYTDIVLPLQQWVGVAVDPEVRQKIEVVSPRGEVKIDQDRSTLLVKPEFFYPPIGEGKIRAYDRTGERQLIRLLEKYGFLPVGNGEQNLFALSNEDQIYSFLTTGISRLQELASVFYSEGFRPVRRIHSGMMPGISFGLEDHLFEVSFDFGELSFADVQEALRSYRLKKNYFRLKNGEFLDLETPEFREFSELVEGLGIKERDVRNQPVLLPLYRSVYLDQVEASFSDLRILKKDSFLSMVAQMKEVGTKGDVIPETLSSVLRGYQRQGVLWLERLHRFHFGGILADDMGLGKTLQVIAFLLSEKKNGAMPSLVVAPTSLVYNWEAEVQKFAPELKTLLIQGGVAERGEKLSHIPDADLVVTSYALLRRDIAKYQEIRFRACIIDEAQNIKNPKTINSKSVKQVQAQTYFALTGTPIENSLTELWSIFDFLMPGYLFSCSKFQEQFEIPVFRDQDPLALARLKRLIAPFLLRRMKKDVLQELPEKINSVLFNEMTHEQSKVYASYLATAKSEFRKLLAESSDIGRNRFEILSLLTRLRQICCHPSLFLEDYAGESGKLEQAMELIAEAVSGQHRILVFSQFTSMLEKVKEKLDELSLEYFYLDGKTSVEDRKLMIDAFQSGEKSLFLLSLKAGGTGLTLTGADMVVHLDPWWNPAVEDQATDRVYRIGQANRVQVFKLITKNSIEEKIFALQEKKSAFVTEMTQFEEENPIFTLDRDEWISLFESL